MNYTPGCEQLKIDNATYIRVSILRAKGSAQPSPPHPKIRRHALMLDNRIWCSKGYRGNGSVFVRFVGLWEPARVALFTVRWTSPTTWCCHSKIFSAVIDSSSIMSKDRRWRCHLDFKTTWNCKCPGNWKCHHVSNTLFCKNSVLLGIEEPKRLQDRSMIVEHFEFFPFT